MTDYVLESGAFLRIQAAGNELIAAAENRERAREDVRGIAQRDDVDAIFGPWRLHPDEPERFICTVRFASAADRARAKMHSPPLGSSALTEAEADTERRAPCGTAGQPAPGCPSATLPDEGADSPF